ncbi:hypothetical protein, partial [Peribacillus simplex]|uniref:hypothetical protein n=1 Tax=Peribacillus simplex TaxID=1478 RepID=UPI0019D6144F
FEKEQYKENSSIDEDEGDVHEFGVFIRELGLLFVSFELLLVNSMLLLVSFEISLRNWSVYS